MHHDLVLIAPGVLLVPLEEAHARPLLALIDDDLWAGMTSPVPRSVDDMDALVRAAHDEPGRTAFAVLADGGEVIGSTSLYDHVPAMARVEIGFTYYARRVWGSRVNPACKLALFTQAFDEWGCARVALRADGRVEDFLHDVVGVRVHEHGAHDGRAVWCRREHLVDDARAFGVGRVHDALFDRV